MPLSSTHNVYYVPPPDQAPNLFASFTSQFLRTRTPWAQDLLARRLDAMDPAKKAAALATLDEQRAAILEQGQAWRKAQFDSIDNAMKQWRDVVQQESGVLRETISAKRSVATANAATARMFEKSSMSSQKDIQALHETLLALEELKSSRGQVSDAVGVEQADPYGDGGLTKGGALMLESDLEFTELSNKADALIRKLSNEDLPPGELADNTSELARMAGLGSDVQRRIREQAGGIGDIAVAKRRRIPGMVGLGTIDRSAQHENALAQLEKLEAQRSWLLQQPMSPEVQQALGQLENSRRRVEFEFDNPLIGRPGDAFIRTEASQRKIDELRAARLQALQQPVEIDRGTSFEYTPVLQTVQPGQPPGQPRGPGGGRQPAPRQQARGQTAGSQGAAGQPDPSQYWQGPMDQDAPGDQQLSALAEYFPGADPYVPPALLKAARAAAPVVAGAGRAALGAGRAALGVQEDLWVPPFVQEHFRSDDSLAATPSPLPDLKRIAEQPRYTRIPHMLLKGYGPDAHFRPGGRAPQTASHPGARDAAQEQRRALTPPSGMWPAHTEQDAQSAAQDALARQRLQSLLHQEDERFFGEQRDAARRAQLQDEIGRVTAYENQVLGQLPAHVTPEQLAAVKKALASGDVTLEDIEKSYGGPR